jgi:hypothetical protein
MVSLKKKFSIFLVSVVLASSFVVGYHQHSTRSVSNCSMCYAVEQIDYASIASVDANRSPILLPDGPVRSYEVIFRTTVHFVVVEIRPPPCMDPLV